MAPPFRETAGRVNDASPTTPTLTTLTTNECLLKDLIQIITFTSNNAKICKQDSLVLLKLRKRSLKVSFVVLGVYMGNKLVFRFIFGANR